MIVTTTKDMVKLSQLDLSGLDIYSIDVEFKLSPTDEKKNNGHYWSLGSIISVPCPMQKLHPQKKAIKATQH